MGRKPFWVWAEYGVDPCSDVISRLWPWLSERRRDRAKDVLTDRRYLRRGRSRPPTPRNLPQESRALCVPESEAAVLLERYAAVVRHWAPRLDLVSPADLERFEERHIEDSLRLLPLVQARPPGDAVDVGSGAGLPGIPLAIAGPGRHWRLLEPKARRAAFLEEVVRELGLDCEVLTATAEEAARDPHLAGAHAFGVSRALAPPAEAFDLLLPLVAPGGIAAVFVGEGAKLPAKAELWSPGIAKMARSRD